MAEIRAHFAGRSAWVAALVMFWLEAMLFQWWSGAFGSDFAGHPDEAAHYVSALMVADYLRMPLQNPLEFARAFAEHYPKVAIGNWPPVLYLLLGAWMLIFGASRWATMIFVASGVAVTAALIFSAARRFASEWVSLACAAVYVAVPLVQTSSNRVMTEHFVTAFMLAATLSLAGYFRTPSSAQAFRFMAWSVVALLTRGSAWALLFMGPIACLQRLYWPHLRNWSLWVAILIVLMVCVPWYMFASQLSRGAMEGYGDASTIRYFLSAFGYFVGRLWIEVPALLVAGTVGCLLAFRRERDPQTTALLGLFVGILLIHSLVPASLEQRFLVQVLPVLMIFAAVFVEWLSAQIHTKYRRGVASCVVSPGATGVICITLALVGAPRQSIDSNGYGAAADRALSLAAGKGAGTMIVSDSIGEGSFVAAAAMTDHRPNHVVVRGSKVLIKEDWVGRPTNGSSTAPDIATVLQQTAVQAVLLDSAIDPAQRRPYHREAADFLAANPSTWRMVFSHSVTRYGHEYPAALTLYRRLPGTAAASLPVDKDSLRRLSSSR